jgi:hypothetical protein
MDFDQVVDHLALARTHICHVRCHGPSPLPVACRTPDEFRDFGAVNHILARQARDVRARPTNQGALDDNGSLALPSKFPGNVLARLTATEDNVLDLFTHDVLQKQSDRCRIFRWLLIAGALSRNCRLLG